jgi:cell division protein FtsB
VTVTAPPAGPIVETATRLEQDRRRREHNTRLLTVLLVIALFLFAIISNLIAYHLIRGLIEDVERQNEQLAIAIDENRLIAAQNADRQDRILLAIGDRLVPKAEVKKLEAQVVALRKEAVKLRRAIADLRAIIAARAPGGG